MLSSWFAWIMADIRTHFHPPRNTVIIQLILSLRSRGNCVHLPITDRFVKGVNVVGSECFWE